MINSLNNFSVKFRQSVVVASEERRSEQDANFLRLRAERVFLRSVEAGLCTRGPSWSCQWPGLYEVDKCLGVGGSINRAILSFSNLFYFEKELNKIQQTEPQQRRLPADSWRQTVALSRSSAPTSFGSTDIQAHQP